MQQVKMALAAGAAVALAMTATPAAAVNTITLLSNNSNCLSTTGCLFSGNIATAQNVTDTQTAYNTAFDPDIALNFLGASNAGFGSITGGGTSSGTWSALGYLIDFYAVKAGNDFLLFSVDPAASSGTWSTAGLPNGNSENDPAVSHLAFFGGRNPNQEGFLPEPSTWISMMLGFGILGYAMRRQRQAVKFNFA